MKNRLIYIFNWIKSLKSFTNKSHQQKFILCFFLNVVSGCADLLLILSLSDLLGGIFDLNSNSNFNISASSNLIPYIVIISALLSGFLKSYCYLLNYRLSAEIAANTSSNLALNYINRSDLRDSRLPRSEVISSLSVHTTYLSQSILTPLINFFSSSILLFVVFAGLFLKLGIVFVVYILIIVFIYILISKITSKRLKRITNTNDESQKELTKTSDEIISGERDIRVYSQQKSIIDSFFQEDLRLKTEQGFCFFLQQVPRISIEVSLYIIIAIAMIIQFLISEQDPVRNNTALVILISVTKILPYFQQVYANLLGVITFHKSVNRLMSLKKISRSKSSNLFAKNSYEKNNNKNNSPLLKIKNLRKIFRNKKTITADSSLCISDLTILNKQKIAIYGSSGSGKSSLLDIVMGFTGFDDGECNLNIDTSNIAFASQNAFIADDTFGFNITNTKNIKKWDFEKMRIACEKASLYFDQSLPYKNISKEIISGGQSKRIGLARALYSGRNILLLDEVDSGLDSKTIHKIFSKLISDDDLTIICVTHNIDLLKNFPTSFCIE